MKTLRNGGIAALALLATAGQAAAQTAKAEACITPQEANALFLSIAPAVVRSIVSTCTPALPANAYLRVRGGALTERYAVPAAAAKIDAAAAFSKMSGEAVSPEMFDIVAGAMVETLATDKIKATDCPVVDRVFALIDPLPAENVAGLVALLLEFAKDKDQKSPLDICKPA